MPRCLSKVTNQVGLFHQIGFTCRIFAAAVVVPTEWKAKNNFFSFLSVGKLRAFSVELRRICKTEKYGLMDQTCFFEGSRSLLEFYLLMLILLIFVGLFFYRL